MFRRWKTRGSRPTPDALRAFLPIGDVWPEVLEPGDLEEWIVTTKRAAPAGVVLYDAKLMRDNQRFVGSRYLIAAAHVSAPVPEMVGPPPSGQPDIDCILFVAKHNQVFAFRLHCDAHGDTGSLSHPVDELHAELARLGVTSVADPPD